MEVDRNGLEVLGRDECLRLLALGRLGRIGFTVGALPSVLPVDFRLDGDRLIVGTRRGGALFAALQDVVVAFEVDDMDPVSRTGWSVAVVGVGAEARGETQLEGFDHQGDARWAASEDQAMLALSTEFVSGRRITRRSSAVRQ